MSKPTPNEPPVLRHVFTAEAAKPKSQKPKPKRPAPISLRLTEEERARLEHEAQGISLSAYVRERLFGDVAQPRRTRGKHPVKDHAALARVLSALGRSNLADDLSTLQWSVCDGSFVVGEACEDAIMNACDDVRAMRHDLMRALGIRTE